MKLITCGNCGATRNEETRKLCGVCYPYRGSHRERNSSWAEAKKEIQERKSAGPQARYLPRGYHIEYVKKGKGEESP